MHARVNVRHFAAAMCAGVAFAASAVPVVTQDSVIAKQDSIKRTVAIEYQLSGEPGIVTIDIQTNASDGVWVSIAANTTRRCTGL